MNRFTIFAGLAAVASVAAAPRDAIGLVAHWSFDRNFASTVNDATYGASPRGGARSVIDRSAGAARIGEGALRLNSARNAGAPAYASVPNPPWGLHKNTVFTMTGWFKLSDTGKDGTDARNFVWESVPNSSVVFSVNTAGNGKVAQFRFRSENYRSFQDLVSGPVVTPDAWHHAATVWNTEARHVRVYVDGKLFKELPMNDADRLEPIRGLNLGGNKLGDGRADWDGWLDDIAIFDLELTARQIGALASGMPADSVLARVPEPETQRIVANRALPAPEVPALDGTSQGPLIGHVGQSDAILWARVPQPGVYAATAKTKAGKTVSARATAVERNDWSLKWNFTGLEANAAYDVTFAMPSGSRFTLRPLTFRTAPAAGAPAKVSLSFGSCVDFPPNPIWNRIADESPDGFVMLGDTPYIDSTNLDAMRWAYRRFSAIALLEAAFQRIPFWATWDDHDFGANAADGTMPNKEISRRVFVEYRPLPGIGENGAGSYSSFRRGPVEVFLLDTRWFARTEKSWSNPAQDTMLGRQQWAWLQRGLRASTAPFKILASGMIWSLKNNSTEDDSWGAYGYERDAIFRWIGENRISGVVLIGGDIHVSRLMKWPVRDSAGYDLTEFTTSPMHDRVNPKAAVPDPKVIADALEPWTFLKITVDSTVADPVLTGEVMNRDGKRFFRQELKASSLRRQEGF